MATRILLASLLVLNLRITPHEAFVTVSSRSAFQQQRRSSSSSSNTISSSSLHSTKPSAAADARGAAVLLEQVSVFRGPNAVLQNIDWRIEPRTKWALVGSNGAGKSTLLKALVNELQYEGRIILSQQEDIGYLQQTAVAGSNKTVYEEAAAGMKEVNKARLEMEAAMEREDMEAYQKALTRFEALDGYKQDGVIANVLNGLGFTNFDIRCDELSGGWQMRVAFARLLLSEPKLCLMDEPGNHLDSAAKKWLARYLAEYQGEGSMILVTHDVELLQSMDHIAEIIPEATNSLQIYKSCTYNQYLELKEQRAAAAVAEFERNAEKAAKLQSFVDRWGASATKATAAQSRVKQLEKMQREGLMDDPAFAVIAKRFKPNVVLPPPPKAMGDVLLSLENALVGHTASKPLVSNVELSIEKGMKLLIRGPNGAGKSTILHSLRGSIPLLDGERKENPSLLLGMFTQDLAQELDVNARAVDLVTAYARLGPGGDITISDEVARSAMGRLGLQGDKPLRRIRDLSGGEKARVALAMFTLKPCNLYLFDEVSNHLDAECVEALGEALSEWDKDERGAMVVVSHDRNFCSQLEFTHVATVSDGKCILEQRDACEKDWQVESLMQRSTTIEADTQSNGATTTVSPQPIVAAVEVTSSAATATTASTTATAITDPKLRKKHFNAPKRIAKIEEEMQRLEQQIALVDDKMMRNGKDVGQIQDLFEEKQTLQQKMDSYMEEWEELEQLLSGVAMAN